MKNHLITLAAIATLISMPAIQADEGAPKPEKAKGKMAADKDGDGFLSREEFYAMPYLKGDREKGEARFVQLDTNGDGKVSAEEFKAGQKGKGKKGDGKKQKKAE